MLKLLATDGPLKSIAKPINDAVEWVTGGSKPDDDHTAGQEDGGEKPAENGEAAVTITSRNSLQLHIKNALRMSLRHCNGRF